jgi:23S rRNA (pseudouridine1915-N3)-methyltransferase
LKYRIISVGKISESFYRDGIAEYLKRLKPYTSIEMVEGLEEKTSPRAGDKEIQEILKKEGEKVLKLLGQDETTVALDIAARQFSSEEWAAQIDAWNASGKKRVNFIVGGSHGLADEIKKRADVKLSFSPMTFPHQMTVLILAEQLYRGFKIIKGEPYHK